MKKIFKVSVSKVYVMYLLLLTVLVIGTYSSYAYFTVNKEKKNAIKMVTGNLIGELKVDGVVNDKLVINGNQTKIFEVEVINKNNRKARFNFYYKGSLSNDVEVGYIEDDGYNAMVKENGVILETNGTLGYFLKYRIRVRNNTSDIVTIPLGYSVGLDYNDLSLPSNCYLFEKAKIEDGPGVKALLTNYTNEEIVQDYDVNYDKEDPNVKENKMYVFNHKDDKGTQQSDWSSEELKDYRYIGANPNNYVTFNNEVAGWRIIGIETVDDGSGLREKRIKLIRKDLLPVGTDNYMSWDNKPNGTGSSESEYGSSDWRDSRLMMVLNPGYDSNPLASGGKGSLYWNRQSGSCPLGSNNGTVACDFSGVGLLPEAQKLIGDAKWYLAGVSIYSSPSNGTTKHSYSYERGDTVYQSSSHPRKINWTGRVGLMYPSDYGYATSGGTRANRDMCLAKELYNWDGADSEEITDCKNNDWIYNNNKSQWTIISDTSSSGVFDVNSPGYVRSYYANYNRGVRPAVYLLSNVKLLKGTGSEIDPFEFGL